MVNRFNLFFVNLRLKRDILIDILLHHRNVMLKVEDSKLVQEVVHVLIHSFDDMVPNIVGLVRTYLEHAYLHVLEEVPSEDLEDVPLVVIHYHLEPFQIALIRLQDPNDFISFHKLHCEVDELVPVLLDDELILVLFLFQETILEKSSSKNNKDVIVEELALEIEVVLLEQQPLELVLLGFEVEVAVEFLGHSLVPEPGVADPLL